MSVPMATPSAASWHSGTGCSCREEGRHGIDDDIDDRYDFLDGLQYINKPDQVETDDSWLTVVLDATGLGRIGQVEAWFAARSSTSTTIFPMSTSPSGNTSGPTARRRGKS